MPEQKLEQSTEQQDEWQQDLNPNPMAGQNVGVESSQGEKEAPTASEIKEVQRHLEGLTKDELKQIPVLPEGMRLKQGATYVDLRDAERQEFTARGDMETSADNWYVPKSEVDYILWNRLTGVENPERLGEASES